MSRSLEYAKRLYALALSGGVTHTFGDELAHPFAGGVSRAHRKNQPVAPQKMFWNQGDSTPKGSRTDLQYREAPLAEQAGLFIETYKLKPGVWAGKFSDVAKDAPANSYDNRYAGRANAAKLRVAAAHGTATRMGREGHKF